MGMRRRKRVAGNGGEDVAATTVLQFYSDEEPGIKLSPTTVLVASIGFIAFVAILHVIGKLYLIPQYQQK
ncbi:hypothetical protein RD792_014610 [Penstemon davidsonii]|uniref:Protein transport protein Sec61 subunit beta n=1 Tax=Penstemon davidsonii TaxID=160366 RepID=A0ABR0CQP7_9LAMI|nr:hypothetical protein RD792_014610 [Penstemon davidsonii]